MTAEVAWLNGRFVPPSDLVLSHADAGFASGVTLTDFCRTYRHRLFRWPDHLRRLRGDCATCQVPLPYPDDILTAVADELAVRHATTIGAGEDLAVITFVTPGPLGYLSGSEDSGPPTVGMHTITLAKKRYRRFFTEGVTLGVAGVWPSDPMSVVPPGVKHRSRLHWWMASRSVNDPESSLHCPDAVPVLLDQHGGFADTPVGAVFAIDRGNLIAPVTGTVLDSVSVGVVKELCQRVGIPVPDAPPLDFRSLLRSDDCDSHVDEMLLAGSGFGIAGVRRFAAGPTGRDFDWPGPVYRRLVAEWSAMVGLDVPGQFVD